VVGIRTHGGTAAALDGGLTLAVATTAMSRVRISGFGGLFVAGCRVGQRAVGTDDGLVVRRCVTASAVGGGRVVGRVGGVEKKGRRSGSCSGRDDRSDNMRDNTSGDKG
jgi:hypothetical protein